MAAAFATTPFEYQTRNNTTYFKARASAVQAGSVLWCFTWQYSATATCSGVADDLGNTWVQAFGPIRGGAGNGQGSLYGFYCLNSVAGGSPTNGTITATWSASGNGGIVIGEVTGLAGGGALDQAVSNNTPVVGDISCGTLSTLAQAVEAVVGFAVSQSAATPVHSGFTADVQPDSQYYERCCRVITASTASIIPGWGQTGNGAYAAGAMAFKDAVSGSPPSVTTHPSNQTVTAPTTATFNVAFAGSPAPTKQWQRSTNGGGAWNDIGGATADSYTTPATSVSGGSANNGDQYRCVGTNVNGNATTNAATLTVNASNPTPTFPGPNIGNITQTKGIALTPVDVSAKFSDTDGLTFSAVGSWPAGVSVSSAGVISGTPTAPGTYGSLRVRATDTASQTVDSNNFTITIAQVVFTSEPLKDWNGVLQASKALDYIRAHNATTGAPVLTKTGLSTNGLGIVTFGDDALDPATTYLWDWLTTDGHRRMPPKATP